MQVIHILRREDLPIAVPEQPVIRLRLARKAVDRRVSNDDAQLIWPLVQILSNFQPVWRMPKYPDEFAIERNLSGFANRRIKPCAHVMLARRRGKSYLAVGAEVDKEL